MLIFELAGFISLSNSQTTAIIFLNILLLNTCLIVLMIKQCKFKLNMIYLNAPFQSFSSRRDTQFILCKSFFLAVFAKSVSLSDKISILYCLIKHFILNIQKYRCVQLLKYPCNMQKEIDNSSYFRTIVTGKKWITGGVCLYNLLSTRINI